MRRKGRKSFVMFAENKRQKNIVFGKKFHYKTRNRKKKQEINKTVKLNSCFLSLSDELNKYLISLIAMVIWSLEAK